MNIKDLREEIVGTAAVRVSEAHMHPNKRSKDIVMFNINQFKNPDGSVKSDIYKLGWLYGVNHMPYQYFESMIEEYYMNHDTSKFIIKRGDLLMLAMCAIAEQGLLRTQLTYVDGEENYENDILVKANKTKSPISLKAMVENEYLYMTSTYTGRDNVIVEVYETIFKVEPEPTNLFTFAQTVKSAVRKAFK